MTAIPTTQRAWFATKAGEATEVVKLNPNAPVPTPGAGEVLVRVHSVSMNPVGYKLLRVGWPVHTFPSLVEHDFSGVVVQLGNGVQEYSVGTEVLGSINVKDYFKGKGAMAEYISIEVANTVPKPASLSHDQCAALPIIGQTAHGAILKKGLARTGDRLFVNGGSTGVGIVAIQLAKKVVGAEVVASCSGRNVGFVKSLGADKVYDYTSSPLATQLASSPPTISSVLDCVGQLPLYKACPTFLKPDGTFMSIFVDPGPGSGSGATPGGKPKPPSMMGLLGANVSAMVSRRPAILGGVNRKYEMFYGEWDRTAMRELLGWMEQGKLTIPIDSVHKADEAGIAAAYERSMSGRAVGKIIVRMI